MVLIKKKNGQLMIFILIAFVVLSSFIYLFSNSFESKNNDLKNSNNLGLSSGIDSNLFPLKNNVDYCLNLQLNKATMIAGLKGGFIYNDNGGSYSNGVIIDDFYNSQNLLNLGLSLSHFLSNVLIHFDSSVDVPSIEFSSGVYSHSIKDDFEKYVLNNFLDCIKLDSYKNIGYEVLNEKYSGFISSQISSQKFKVSGIIGEVDDNVEIILENKKYFGKIESLDLENDFSIILFNDDISNLVSNLDFNKLNVRNLDSKIKIDIKFNNENIVANLDFPVIIQKGNFSTSYSKSSATSNVRFSKYLELSKLLMNAKSNDRTLNLSNENEITTILSESNYFRNTKFQDIKIIETKLRDDLDYKNYIYSIVDYDSKIFGEPFIFNFAYINSAPKIDRTKLDVSSNSGTDILFITSENVRFTKNLKDLVVDKQFFDNYDFKFLSDSKSTSIYDYSINANGALSFLAKQKGSFFFDIGITDGETSSIEKFIFSSGLPSNDKNSDTLNCISYENFEDRNSLFPISNSLKNSLSSYTNSNGEQIVFGYSLAPSLKLNSNDLTSSKLKLNPACLGIDGTDFSLIYNFDGGQNSPLNSLDNSLEIPTDLDSPTLVSIDVLDLSGNSILTQPFKINILPATCLGPDKFSSTVSDLLGNPLENSGTCCEISSIPTSRNSLPNSKISNILSGNGLILNANAYFTYDLENSVINPETQILADSFSGQNSPSITSLFGGKVKASCGGEYPRYEQNIKSVSNDFDNKILSSELTSSLKTYSSQITEINLLGNPITTNNLPFEISELDLANSCEFAILNDYLDINFKTNDGSVFKIGLTTDNNNLVKSNPLPIDYRGANVKCSNDDFITFKNNPTTNDWINLADLTLPLNKDFIGISKGFCQIGTTNCVGNLDVTGSKFESDDRSICKDFSLNNNGNIINKISNDPSWICDSTTSTTCEKAVVYSCPIN